MNVYDWDNTIYRGDSTLDFVLYLYRRRPLTLLSVPRTAASGLLYVLHMLPKLTFKQNLYHMFVYVKDMEEAVDAFTSANKEKVKDWYKKQQADDDIVISASPAFLISAFCSKVGIGECLASNVDLHTGRYDGLNCHGEEKVRRFRQLYPKESINAFYSDSLSDEPLAALARKAYLVKGDTLKSWPFREKK